MCKVFLHVWYLSLTLNGEVVVSTVDNMEYEEVFLSSICRCWRGFDIFEGNPLQYQIYTYEVSFFFLF